LVYHELLELKTENKRMLLDISIILDLVTYAVDGCGSAVAV